MTRYFDAMRAEIQAHGGTIEKYIGDAIMAVFGLPTRPRGRRAARRAGGDRACSAALDRLNDELERTWGVRLANRTGVNTGEVVAGDSDHAASGWSRATRSTPRRAWSRPRPADEILIGELTYRLVRDCGRRRGGRAAGAQGQGGAGAGVAAAGRAHAAAARSRG